MYKTLLLTLLVFFSLNVNASFAQRGRRGGSANPNEHFVQLMKVSGNRITVAQSSGRGRRGAMQNGQDGGIQMQGRRGFGRRGRLNSSGNALPGSASNTIVIEREVKITLASKERRTNKFRVGIEISGGLRNKIFRNIPSGGIPIRIVTDGTKITEINVIQESDTSKEDIAVKPKRPPRIK